MMNLPAEIGWASENLPLGPCALELVSTGSPFLLGLQTTFIRKGSVFNIWDGHLTYREGKFPCYLQPCIMVEEPR